MKLFALQNRRKDVYIILVFWFFGAFLFTVRGVLTEEFYSFIPIVQHFVYELLCISPWVIGIPLIVKISSYLPLEEGAKYFLVHAILALFIFLFHSVVQTFINSVYYGLPFNYEYLKGDFLFFLDVRSLLYLVILISIGYKEYYRKLGKLTIRKQKLKTKLERTRLSAMINGVQPEFLIKNIYQVSELINQDAKKAEDLVVSFSDLIRLLVRYTQKVNLSITDDIAPYQIYVKFLSVKLNTAITFKSDIKDDVKLKTIPKSFLVIPLLDRIADFNPERKNNDLHTITYRVVENSDSLLLHLELSSLCSITEDELNKLYHSFIKDIGEKRLNSDGLAIKSLSKEDATVLLKMEIKQSLLNEQ
jgi:hypothetical protein